MLEECQAFVVQVIMIVCTCTEVTSDYLCWLKPSPAVCQAPLTLWYDKYQDYDTCTHESINLYRVVRHYHEPITVTSIQRWPEAISKTNGIESVQDLHFSFFVLLFFLFCQWSSIFTYLYLIFIAFCFSCTEYYNNIQTHGLILILCEPPFLPCGHKQTVRFAYVLCG